MTKYQTIKEASQAAIELGIQTSDEYLARYNEDPRLSSSPNMTYKNDWEDFGTWYGFLNKKKPGFYSTILEASQAAIKLDIQSRPEYLKCYKKDSYLPASPDKFYKTNWERFGKWYGFFGHEKPTLHKTILEASQAAIKLGIQSASEYYKCYEKDPYLPGRPDTVYKNDWDDFGK